MTTKLHHSWSLASGREQRLAYCREHLTPLQASRLDAGFMSADEAHDLCEAHLAKALGVTVVDYDLKAYTLTDQQYTRYLAVQRLTFPEHAAPDCEWRVYTGSDHDRKSVYVETVYGFGMEVSLDHDVPERSKAP